MSAAQILALTPGKHNMASEAFLELKLARAEGRTPKGQELRFSDVLDTLNPLQHLPVLGNVYRALTGDTISAPAKVTGAALYGGPMGAIASVMGEAINPTKPETDAAPAPVLALAAPENAAANAATKTAANSAAITANDALITGALARPAAKAAPQTAAKAAPLAPLPKLSSEAFDALIRSFPQGELTASTPDNTPDEPDQKKTAEKMAEQILTGGPLPLTPPALAAPQTKWAAPGDLASVMRQTLDKYDALKSAPDGE